MFVATLRDHGAAHVTAVVPYLAYARKDRTTQPYDPVASRHVALLLEAVGTDAMIVLEAHNLSALQNAFRIPVLHLSAHEAFDAIVDEWATRGPLAVVFPDPGGVKRVQLWREHLEARLARPVGFAMIDKRRSGGRVSDFDLVAGDVAGMHALVLDDLIASGGTIRRAAQALRAAGALEVAAFAAHGLFLPPAAQALGDPALLAMVAVCDGVPAFRVPPDGALAARLRIVTVAPLIARAIERCRRDEKDPGHVRLDDAHRPGHAGDRPVRDRRAQEPQARRLIRWPGEGRGGHRPCTRGRRGRAAPGRAARRAPCGHRTGPEPRSASSGSSDDGSCTLCSPSPAPSVVGDSSLARPGTDDGPRTDCSSGNARASGSSGGPSGDPLAGSGGAAARGGAPRAAGRADAKDATGEAGDGRGRRRERMPRL